MAFMSVSPWSILISEMKADASPEGHAAEEVDETFVLSPAGFFRAFGRRGTIDYKGRPFCP
jgi:hypothetical protein